MSRRAKQGKKYSGGEVARLRRHSTIHDEYEEWSSEFISVHERTFHFRHRNRQGIVVLSGSMREPRTPHERRAELRVAVSVAILMRNHRRWRPRWECLPSHTLYQFNAIATSYLPLGEREGDMLTCRTSARSFARRRTASGYSQLSSFQEENTLASGCVYV